MARKQPKHTAFLCGALLIVISASARAQAPGFSISLRAPEDAGCVGERAIIQAVEARVGAMAVPQASQPGVAITVEIDRTAAGFRAQVQVADRSTNELGSRELRADSSCDALTEMLTLVIAASIGLAEPTTPEPAAPPPPAPPPPAAEAPVVEHEIDFVHDTEVARSWAFDIAGSLRVQTGVAPGPLLGPSLALWASWGALRLGIAGIWLAPRGDDLANGLVLRMTTGYAELNLCGTVVRSARTGLDLCVASQTGAAHAELQGLARVTPRWDALVQLAASVRAQLLFSERVGATLALGAALPVVYPSYSHVNERGESRVDHKPELGLWVGLDVWIRLQP